MTDTATSTPTVPIAKIRDLTAIDPRRSRDDDTLQELAASIREQGILQPVLVRPIVGAANGKTHDLVAGRRRVAAAKLAGLKEIPIHVAQVGTATADDAARAHAIVENLQREDLSAIEEAEGVRALQTQTNANTKGLVKMLGKSDDWVNDRLRLLKLPETARDAIAAGAVGWHAMPYLARVADVAPALAGQFVAMALEDKSGFDRRALEGWESIARMYQYLSPQNAGVVHMSSGMGYDFDDVPMPDEARAELAPRYDAIPVVEDWGRDRPVEIAFDDADADAARAYGCLLEIPRPGAFKPLLLICDPGFIADRVKLKIEAWEKKPPKGPAAGQRSPHHGTAKPKRKKPADVREEAVATVREKHPDWDDDKIAAQAKKNADRIIEKDKKEAAARSAAAYDAKVAARGRNLALGVETAKKLAKPKLTADVMRLIAEFAWRGSVGVSIFAAMRYVDDGWQTEIVQRNGRSKVTYEDPQTVHDHYVDRLAKARSPEEIAGIVLRGLIVTMYVDQLVVAQSDRVGVYLGYEADARLEPIAAKLKAVPAGVVEHRASKVYRETNPAHAY